MGLGNEAKCESLRQLTALFWKIKSIRSLGGNQLKLTLDGSKSLDKGHPYAHWGKDKEMALSTLELYVRRYGISDFEGQALTFLSEHGLHQEDD